MKAATSGLLLSRHAPASSFAHWGQFSKRLSVQAELDEGNQVLGTELENVLVPSIAARMVACAAEISNSVCRWAHILRIS